MPIRTINGEKKVHRSYCLTPEATAQLANLAKKEKRSFSDMLERLIRRAYTKALLAEVSGTTHHEE